MNDIINITSCNIAQLIAESNRFLFHVLLIHISTCIIEGRQEIFTETLFKTLLITAFAIVMYNLFFRKIVEPKIEKMKMICSRNIYKKKEKIRKITHKDPLRPKHRARLDKIIRSYNESGQSTRSEKKKRKWI